MFYIAFASYLSVSAQPDRELFHMDYSVAPMNGSGGGSVLYTTNTHIRFPWRMNENFLLASSFGYETLWSSSYPIFGGEGLHGLSHQLLFGLNLKNDRSLVLFATAGIYSDLRDVSAEDFRYTGGIRYKFKWHRDITMAYGLGVTKQFFGTMVAPFVDFDWKFNDRWRLSGPFPIHSRLRYKVAPRSEFVLFLKPDNATYRLSASEFDSRYFQKKQWNLGLSFEYMLTQHWQLTVRSGGALRRKFEIYDASETGVLSILTFDVRGQKRSQLYQYEDRAFFGEVALAWLIPGSK